MSSPNGYVTYEGPSRMDGAPIVAITTLHSSNRKTGDMPQVWILRQDLAPTQAASNGSDESICGDCAFRPILKHKRPNGELACYVTLIHGPNQIWKAYRQHRYPDLPSDYVFDRPVRIGSYGDPAALPLRALRAFVQRCHAGWTAYTHQWKRYPGLAQVAMASVNNASEQQHAIFKGFRTFRVIQTQDSMPLLIGAGTQAPNREIICPAGAHAQFAVGERTTCAKCRICDGRRDQDRRANIVVHAH
jgi:hypothetical protein